MKPLLAFAFDNYYSAGPRGDFVGDFNDGDTLPPLDVACGFMDVLDTRTGEWRSFTYSDKINGWWTGDAAVEAVNPLGKAHR